MDIFQGILLILAGVMMFVGLFLLIRNYDKSWGQTLTLILAYVALLLLFCSYLGIAGALILRGSAVLLGW